MTQNQCAVQGKKWKNELKNHRKVSEQLGKRESPSFLGRWWRESVGDVDFRNTARITIVYGLLSWQISVLTYHA